MSWTCPVCGREKDAPIPGPGRSLVCSCGFKLRGSIHQATVAQRLVELEARLDRTLERLGDVCESGISERG